MFEGGGGKRRERDLGGEIGVDGKGEEGELRGVGKN